MPTSDNFLIEIDNILKTLEGQEPYAHGPSVSVISANPSFGIPDQTLDIQIIGDSFQDTAIVEFSGGDITVNSTLFISPTLLQSNITISNIAVIGLRDITVTNFDGVSGTGIGIFEVITPPPVVTLANPSNGNQNTTLDVSIVGQYFQSGATVSFSGTGIVINGAVNYIDTEHVTVNIAIDATAPLTARDITVTNPDLQQGVGLGIFTVTPGSPTISKVLPAAVERGQTADVEIFGSCFQTGATVSFSGLGITVNAPVIFVDEFQLIANITIASTATLSTRDVTVANTDTQSGVGMSLLTVIAYPPTISAIDPAFGVQGEIVVNVIITGTYFQDGAIVAFSGYGVTNIAPGSVATFINSTQLQVTIAIAEDAESTARSVYVTNPDFKQGIGTGLFTINPRQPTVVSVTPASVEQDLTLDIHVNGSAFQNGATVEISGTGIIYNGPVVFVSSTQLDLNITISAVATLGLRSITVTNPNTAQDTGIDILTVTPPQPRLTSVTPATGYQGDILDLVILGEYFQSGAIVNFSGTGIIIEFSNYISPTRLDVRINIASDAFISKRDIFIQNPGYNPAVSLEAFEVIPLPITVTSISPNTGKQQEVITSVQIIGVNFQVGATVSFSGTGITVTSVSSITSTEIWCNLSIGSAAIPSVRNVIVRNLDTGIGTGVGLFTVTSLPPEVISVDPIQIERDQTTTVDIIGTHFYAGATVSFSGNGIVTDLVTWITTELLTVTIAIDPAADLTIRDVTVTNIDLQEHTGLGLLEIISFSPTLISVIPALVNRNESHLLEITGEYFQDGAKVEVSGIGMAGPLLATFVSSTVLQISVFIEATTVLGFKDITVLNPDGKQETAVGILEVGALAPLVVNVSPASNSRGQSADIIITGSYFQVGATVSFSGLGIIINGLITINNSSQISANISIESNAALGLRDITITNPDTKFGVGTSLFEIIPLNPIVSGITPSEAERNTSLDITVFGSYFQPGVILTSLGSGIVINSSVYIDSDRVNANITINPAAVLGFRNAVVSNLDGGSGTGINVFKAVEGMPTVTSVDPVVGGRSQIISGSIFGSNFQDGAIVTFSGNGITLNETNFIDSSQIDIVFTVVFDADLTTRDITVLNPDNKQAIGIGLFTVVLLDPTVLAVIPAISNRGKTLDVQIIGSNFQFNPVVTFSGIGITINGSIMYISSNQLTATITIAADTALGLRDVTITNIDGGIGVGLALFEISAISVASINPVEGKQGEVLDIIILGDGFQKGALVNFSGKGIVVNSVIVNNFTEIVINISISDDAELVLRSVTVVNSNGEMTVFAASFNVTALAPIITAITPKYGEQGSNIIISCSGYYFQSGALISFSSTGITVASTAYIDRNYLSANIIIDPIAPKTNRDITVVNPDTQSNIGLDLFTITKAPEIFQVSPNEAKQGETVIVDVIGDFFQVGAIASFSGSDIIVKDTTFIGINLLKVELQVDEDADLTLRNVTITNPDKFFVTGLDLIVVIPKYSYVMELDPYNKWEVGYTKAEKDTLNDFYQELVFLLVDEHIYDNSKVAVGYKNEKYIFTGRYNVNDIPIHEEFVPENEGSTEPGGETFSITIDNSLKFLSSEGDPTPPEPEPYVEGSWQVYHNTVLTDCQVTLNKTFHTFKFSLFLNRGVNKIKIVYAKDGIEVFSNILYVNTYNIHLLLQMYALEFLDHFTNQNQVYSNQYLYDDNIIAQGLRDNFASMLKMERDPGQTTNQFKSFITGGLEAHWSALTVKGISKLLSAYNTTWGLKEYYKNRTKLSNTLKLYSDGSLTVFWPFQQVVINRRHYYIPEGSFLLTANTVSYLYVDEEVDANGYLIVKKANTLPSTTKVKIDAPVDYIEMQIKENKADFNDTDWEAVIEYFVANLAYNENVKFFYIKFRKADKEVSKIYYRLAEYFLLGIASTGASSINSIDDGKVSMSRVNSRSMRCYGFELFLTEAFDKTKQERVLAIIERIKSAHTKGYIMFDKRLPANIV